MLSRSHLAVVSFLHEHGAMSRSDLAQNLELTKAAVTIITNELIKRNIVFETGEQYPTQATPARGRRKVLIDVNENFMLIFGLVVRYNEIVIGLTNLGGAVLDKCVIDTTKLSYRETLEVTVKSLFDIMKNACISSDRIIGMGICGDKDCAPSPEGNIMTWLNRFKTDLSHAVDFKLFACETAVGALIAQRLFNRDDTDRSILILRCGEPVTSSLMINKAIYRGKTGNAGNFSKLASINWDFTDDESQDKQFIDVLSLHARILDLGCIYLLGDGNDTSASIDLLRRAFEDRDVHAEIANAFLSEKTIYLAACGLAANCAFYKEIKNV